MIGMIRLNEITFDATRVRANNNRYATLTATAIEARLQELDQDLKKWLQDVESTDQQDQAKPQELPDHLKGHEARKMELQNALDAAKELDEQRRKNQQFNPEKNPGQIPTTDPDSRLMPNKEGGYAPNYTPTAAVTTHGDFIVNSDVLDSVVEHTAAVPAVKQIETDFGEVPEAFPGDGHFATGQNIKAFAASK
jgi:hypothetical protein